MHHNLLRELAKRSIIGINSEIDARYNGYDMAGSPIVQTLGNFAIKCMIDNGNNIVLRVADTVTGNERKIKNDDIVLVEGMAPIRLAETYGLDIDGGKLAASSRRGRRRREEIEAEDGDE